MIKAKFSNTRLYDSILEVIKAEHWVKKKGSLEKLKKISFPLISYYLFSSSSE